MKFILTRAMLAAALLLAPGSAAVALQAAPEASAPARWHVDGSGSRCVLTRRLAGTPAATLILRSYPGSGEYELMLSSPDWPRSVGGAKKEAALTLAPGAAVYRGEATILPLERGLGDAVAMPLLPGSFLRDFARASSLDLAVGGQPVATYALPTAAKAADAFAFCESEKLIEWGADPAGFEPGAARPRPVGDPRQWLTDRDLRGLMLAASYSAAVIARLTIGIDGRAEECTLLEATAIERLQAIACRALKDRARYEPARDKDGKPIRSVAVHRAGWSVHTEFRLVV
jgi:hypothetical protein